MSQSYQGRSMSRLRSFSTTIQIPRAAMETPSNEIISPAMENSDEHLKLGTELSSSPEELESIHTPWLEPTAPTTKKRSTPDDYSVEPVSEPAAKRRRTEDHGIPTPPAEEVITAILDTRPSFDDESSHLLQRAATLVLEHVGFNGVTKEALEEFCGEIDSYATNFLSYVTESMLAARRSEPTPLDFEYALRREGLTARLLKPHLKPPVPSSKLEPLFTIIPQEEPVHESNVALLGADLDGEFDKRSKGYIPKHFPSFPSKHTYKATEVKLDRETDPRKIREKATEEARHGEEALRRLVKVGKTGDQKYARRGMGNASKPQKRHQMWEEAMEDLMAGKPRTRTFGGGDGTDEQSILVNADKPYRRRPADRRKSLL